MSRVAGSLVLATVGSAILAGSSAADLVVGEQCSGSSIAGQGSPLEAAGYSVLSSAFNSESDHSPRACSGTQGALGKPAVAYSSSSGLVGLESWGVNSHAADFSSSNAFIATDVPPNAVRREEILANSTEAHWGDLQTIPVRQRSVAVVVNLPSNCKANNSVKESGFLVLDNTTLEKIWRGEIKQWDEITDGGDVIENHTNNDCEAKYPITRIVSKGDSGASWALEKYLYLIDKEKNIAGSLGWRELAEGASGQQWPGSVTRPSEEGEEAVAALVQKTPGSIAVLEYTQKVEEQFTGVIHGTAGEGVQRFIAPLQNNGLVGGASARYSKLKGGSVFEECDSVRFSNDGVQGLPASTSALWNDVSTSTTEPGSYPLCALSYVLAFSKYSKLPGTSQAEATTVSNYLRFEFSRSTGGGLEEFSPRMSAALIEESRRGIETIQY